LSIIGGNSATALSPSSAKIFHQNKIDKLLWNSSGTRVTQWIYSLHLITLLYFT